MLRAEHAVGHRGLRQALLYRRADALCRHLLVVRLSLRTGLLQRSGHLHRPVEQGEECPRLPLIGRRGHVHTICMEHLHDLKATDQLST